jgi:hypothetical protein
MNEDDLHSYYLQHLIYKLDKIGEDRNKVISIIKEPIWTPTNKITQHSLCDLILIYEDYDIPVELKKSLDKKSKAIRQLEAGKEYIQSVLGHEYGYGLFVAYNTNRRNIPEYEYKRINLGGK